jgi:hypothetical protein
MNDLPGPINPNAEYTRADGIELALGAGDDVVARLEDKELHCGAMGLRLLDAFAYPKTVTEAVESITVAGAQGWMELTSLAVVMIETGLIRSGDVSLASHDEGFGAGAVHIHMLNDTARCTAYLHAIEEVVRPGDVVVDIGTGTGLLAMMAARCGAKRVYAIESGAAAAVAESAFRDNALSDTITLVRGRSTDVELPEKVDVIISELIGNSPLAERVVEAHRDARRRFGHAKTRSIPQTLHLNADIVSVPGDLKAELFTSPASLQQWRKSYGVDLSALRPSADDPPLKHYLPAQSTGVWPRAASGVQLGTVNLADADSSDFTCSRETRCEAPAVVDGVLVWFELELGPTVRFSTAPDKASQTNHWLSPLWVIPVGRAVARGEVLVIDYTQRGGKERCWVRQT